MPDTVCSNLVLHSSTRLGDSRLQRGGPRPKNQKNTFWERIFWFRLDFWFFWFYTVFFWVFGSENQKTHVFFGFRRAMSWGRWEMTGWAMIPLHAPTWHVSRSRNRAKTLAIVGFSPNNQKNTCVLSVFQRGDTMKTKKTHVFLVFDPKTKKHSVKPKKFKI